MKMAVAYIIAMIITAVKILTVEDPSVTFAKPYCNSLSNLLINMRLRYNNHETKI